MGSGGRNRRALLEAGVPVPPDRSNSNLAACCVVAGLSPNVAALVVAKARNRGAFLLTKDGERARPAAASFQRDRVKNANEGGRDAYVVYGEKRKHGRDCFLDGVDFCGKFALMLFGGELEVAGEDLVVDSWIKFRVGEKGRGCAVLVAELRRELDRILHKQILGGAMPEETEECRRVLHVVEMLLREESS